MFWFQMISPAPALAPLVAGYWFVQDLAGKYEGRPIWTSPSPGAVLTINLGRPNAMADGPVVPRTSLLGVQSAARQWRSWSDTYFAMAMLTIPGLVRLFPHMGSASADALIELGAIAGDGAARRLSAGTDIAWEPRQIAARLDAWLLSRLQNTPEVTEFGEVVAAEAALRDCGRVGVSASSVGTTRRRLHRLFRRHVGVGPKELADLHRFASSFGAVQTERGDPMSGFADQSDQIRSWRRRLGLTPRAYGRSERSPMAEFFSVKEDALSFYL
jgi:AraC-like DNA-binding protein